MPTVMMAALMILASAWSGPRAPTALGVEVVDAKKVYLGDPDAFTSAATVSSKKVFLEIPEYQKIVDEGLDQNDARYWVLLKKANAKFRAALKRVAQDEGHDLVAEKGAVVSDGDELPDLTKMIIAALEN